MQENRFADMSVKELYAEVFDRDTRTMRKLSEEERGQIVAHLQDLCWSIGELWDAVNGTDIRRGRSSMYGGTPNRRSMTYKLRKAAGFSYP